MIDKIDRWISEGKVPPVLYKYRLWDDHPYDDILKELTIKLSSPKGLEADYEEAFLPYDVKEFTEEKLFEKALDEAKLISPNATKSELERMAKNLRETMLIDDPVHIQEAERLAKSLNEDRYGIFCCSDSIEFVAPWVRLADNGKGFAVGLNSRVILNDSRITGSAGYVNYYSEGNPPKKTLFTKYSEERIDNGMKEIYSIPDRFQHEREFRICRTNFNHNMEITPYTEKDRLVKLSENAYSEIILGFAISRKDRDEIIKLRNRILPSIPIYETAIIGDRVVKTNKI